MHVSSTPSVLQVPGGKKFEIVDGVITSDQIGRYQRFLRHNGIGIAGIEFVVRPNGERVVYDVNTNTNYNAEAEQAAGKSGMGAIADYLGGRLADSLTPLEHELHWMVGG